MESKAFWRFDDQAQRGKMLRTGSGTMGASLLGSCSLRESDTCVVVSGLFRTMSMPTLGPHGPCGRRVGDDLDTCNLGEAPQNQMTALRRPPRLQGEMERRLQAL